MKNFNHDVELLKKEVWYLKTKVVIDLQDQISSLSGGGGDSSLQTQVSALEEKVLAIEGAISSLETNNENNETGIAQLSAKLQSLTTEIESLSTNINEISGEIQSLNSSNESINNSIVLINDSISIIQLAISDLQSTIQDIQGDIEALKEENLSINSTIISIQQTTDSNTQSVENLQSQLQELETKVDNLPTSGGGGSGEEWEVIYDSRSPDETINRGYTSGIVGYTPISVDLTQYKRLRVFVSLFNYECQKEIDICNNMRYETTLLSASIQPRIFYLAKFVITSSRNKFQLGYYTTFNFSTDGTLTLTIEASNEKAFIYRVEGLR